MMMIIFSQLKPLNRKEKTTIRGKRTVEPRRPISYSPLLSRTDLAARAWLALQSILEVCRLRETGDLPDDPTIVLNSD